MKGFQKFLLVIFSIIIVAISVLSILIVAGILDVNPIFNTIKEILFYNKMVTIILSAVCILFGLVGMFSSDDSENMRTGLAIKSYKGTVYITRETFESIIISVARNYPELRNVRAEINVSETGVIANIYAMILPDTVVPTLTAKLQENIKASVLSQTTVEIKEANIKIKGVYVEQNKK